LRSFSDGCMTHTKHVALHCDAHSEEARISGEYRQKGKYDRLRQGSKDLDIRQNGGMVAGVARQIRGSDDAATDHAPLFG